MPREHLRLRSEYRFLSSSESLVSSSGSFRAPKNRFGAAVFFNLPPTKKNRWRPKNDRCRRNVHLYDLLDVLDLVHELHLCHAPDMLELPDRPDRPDHTQQKQK